MKKNYIFTSMLSILCLSFSLSAFAYKPVLTQEKEWYVHHIVMFDSNYLTTEIYKLGNDSTINGITYRKVLECFEKTFTNFKLKGLIREDIENQIVYFKPENEKEQILYSFDVKVNDIIPAYVGITNLNQKYTVKKITTNSEGLKEITIQVTTKEVNNADMVNSNTQTWTESIGDLKGPLYRVNPGYVGEGGRTLSCVFENLNQIYQHSINDETECKIWKEGSGIEENKLQQAIVFNSEQQIISLPFQLLHSKLSVYNTTGKLIKTFTIEKAETQLELKSGIYLVIITNNKLKIHTKICVQ